MSAEGDKTRVRRIHEELWDGRKLEITHELIADAFPSPGSERRVGHL